VSNSVGKFQVLTLFLLGQLYLLLQLLCEFYHHLLLCSQLSNKLTLLCTEPRL
jgi:hypothetical protein